MDNKKFKIFLKESYNTLKYTKLIHMIQEYMLYKLKISIVQLVYKYVRICVSELVEGGIDNKEMKILIKKTHISLKYIKVVFMIQKYSL